MEKEKRGEGRKRKGRVGQYRAEQGRKWERREGTERKRREGKGKKKFSPVKEGNSHFIDLNLPSWQRFLSLRMSEILTWQWYTDCGLLVWDHARHTYLWLTLDRQLEHLRAHSCHKKRYRSQNLSKKLDGDCPEIDITAYHLPWVSFSLFAITFCF